MNELNTIELNAKSFWFYFIWFEDPFILWDGEKVETMAPIVYFFLYKKRDFGNIISTSA